MQDALLPAQKATSMQQSFGPKVTGAAQLAARSAGLLPVVMSVAFSSVAGLLGSAGQGNYAAANAVLDVWMGIQSSQVPPTLIVPHQCGLTLPHLPLMRALPASPE